MKEQIQKMEGEFSKQNSQLEINTTELKLKLSAKDKDMRQEMERHQSLIHPHVGHAFRRLLSPLRRKHRGSFTCSALRSSASTNISFTKQGRVQEDLPTALTSTLSPTEINLDS
ncbi:hypothetical protein COCON_G00178690 [Conger conger]|uniref:Uncharacterized protein n=1 Tax=Conger conger TaxID=82655 RepID=A0A9Q1D5V5_CONCO|nr:hypothetical protein COCON_G00178690 [Conger conger]